MMLAPNTTTSMTMRKILLAAAFSFAAAVPASAQFGAPLDPGFGYYGNFGPSESAGTPTYAQTFQRPAAGFDWLQSFTFYLGDAYADATGSNLVFQAAIYAVNGSQLGAQLFASSPLNGSANYYTFDPYTLGAPNLYLDPGVGTYAIVLQSISTTDNALNVIAAGSPDYAGGALYTVDNLGNLSAVDGTNDAAFEVTLTDGETSSTPEPATLVLVVTGLSLIGAVARRRGRDA